MKQGIKGSSIVITKYTAGTQQMPIFCPWARAQLLPLLPVEKGSWPLGSSGPALTLARMEVMSPPLVAGLTQRGIRPGGGMVSGQIKDKGSKAELRQH